MRRHSERSEESLYFFAGFVKQALAPYPRTSRVPHLRREAPKVGIRAKLEPPRRKQPHRIALPVPKPIYTLEMRTVSGYFKSNNWMDHFLPESHRLLLDIYSVQPDILIQKPISLISNGLPGRHAAMV
jgi:hypothetical protein